MKLKFVGLVGAMAVAKVMVSAMAMDSVAREVMGARVAMDLALAMAVATAQAMAKAKRRGREKADG